MLHWKGRGSGSAAPRVDWPVYPRRAEHNTVAEGGNRRSTIAASSQTVRSPFASASGSTATLPSGAARLVDPQTVLEEAAADLVPGPDPDELDPEVAQAIADGTDRLEARLARAEGDLGGHRQGARSAGTHRAFATDIFTRRGNIFGWAALAWRLGDLLAD